MSLISLLVELMNVVDEDLGICDGADVLLLTEDGVIAFVCILLMFVDEYTLTISDKSISLVGEIRRIDCSACDVLLLLCLTLILCPSFRFASCSTRAYKR